MTVRRPTLLVPSETRNREFDAKLLLACFAAEAGYDCIVGSRMFMHQAIHELKVGLYIAKDMFRSSARILRILRGLGHDVIGWDEESLVYISEESYLRRRVSQETTRWMRRVFAWGPADQEMKSHAEAFRGVPVEAVGNPRIDLLRPELRGYYAGEVAELKRRHGNFILVNSNFGALNHLLPTQRIVPSRIDAAGREALATSGLPFEYWQFRETMFHDFLKMIPELADRFAERRIVIRPHPSEDPTVWQERLAGRDNVIVTNDGSAIPWLIAADIVIHNGCTTGLEAYLLDRPVVCYQPITHPLYDLELPNGVSDSAGSLAELFDLVAATPVGDWPPAADAGKVALVSRHISNLDGPFACERIVQAIDRHVAETPAPVPNRQERRVALRNAWRRRVVKYVNALVPGSKNSRWYTRKRFADLQPDDVTTRISRFAAVLDRFHDLRSEKLRPNIYRISRPGGGSA